MKGQISYLGQNHKCLVYFNMDSLGWTHCWSQPQVVIGGTKLRAKNQVIMRATRKT